MNKTVKWLSAVVPILGVLTLAWCVWSESFAPVVLLQGVILGLVALLMTNRVLLKRSYQERYRLSPLVLLRFFLVLTVEIFRSGIHAIHIMLTDRINIGVVDLPSSITDPLRGVLVASAITLTPGTVAIDFSPGIFKVVWIDCTDTDLETVAENIKGRFERALMPAPAKPASGGIL